LSRSVGEASLRAPDAGSNRPATTVKTQKPVSAGLVTPQTQKTPLLAGFVLISVQREAGLWRSRLLIVVLDLVAGTGFARSGLKSVHRTDFPALPDALTLQVMRLTR